MKSKTFVIIPAFNENQRIDQVLAGVKRHINPKMIIVVDDGSRVPLKLPSVNLLRHPLNQGKGAALNTGITFAITLGAERIIMMDADGQHDPKVLPRVIENLNQFDVVFASRRPTLSAPLVRLLGNKLASIYVNVIFNIYVSDLLSGFRGMTIAAYQKIKWKSSRYGVETEMVARLGKWKHELKFTEIPIETIYIDKYKGVTILDAIKILADSIWWKLS